MLRNKWKPSEFVAYLSTIQNRANHLARHWPTRSCTTNAPESIGQNLASSSIFVGTFTKPTFFSRISAESSRVSNYMGDRLGTFGTVSSLITLAVLNKPQRVDKPQKKNKSINTRKDFTYIYILQVFMHKYLYTRHNFSHTEKL